MEWNSQGAGPTQPVNQPVNHTGSPHKAKRSRSLGNMRFVSVFLLFAATALVVAVLGLTIFGGSKSESSYVKKDQLQAVFLNGGQVYFGDITKLNSQYMRMVNVYYLRVNQTVQPDQDNGSNKNSANDISLVKLGCELHGPTDEMLINKEQVLFWENLKNDGQVAKAVAEYIKQNPEGQKCETSSNSNSNSSNKTTSPAQDSTNATEETTAP